MLPILTNLILVNVFGQIAKHVKSRNYRVDYV